MINDAFARTGLPEEAVRALASHGLLPDRIAFMAPIALFLSNTIGNVPAVVMILKVWHGIPEGTLVGLAILSTLAGNLFLVGSLANLIVAERAKAARRAADLRRPRQGWRAHNDPVHAVCRPVAMARRVHGVLGTIEAGRRGG